MKHTFEELVLPYVNVVIFVTTTFDFWMSKSKFDMSALVINFLILDWEAKHVSIIGINLTNQLQALFEKYKLINKIIQHVKDEGTNLFTMTNVLKQIVSYEQLGILTSLEGVYFGHT